MIRRRSWAKISGSARRRGRGSSARYSAAAAARARNERTTRTPAHSTPRDTSRYTTTNPPLESPQSGIISKASTPRSFPVTVVAPIDLIVVKTEHLLHLRGRIITNKSTNKLEPHEGVASQKAQHNRVSV